MTNVTTRALGPALSQRLQELGGLDAPPATLGELLASWSTSRRPTLDTATLCCAGPSRHEVTVEGHTSSVHCVLDAIVLPLLEGTSGSVRSLSPDEGWPVTIQVDSTGVVAEPPDAVVSFGVAKEGNGSFFEIGCPYINAFPSFGAYERWAKTHPEADTIALSIDEAFLLAKNFARIGKADIGSRPPSG